MVPAVANLNVGGSTDQAEAEDAALRDRLGRVLAGDMRTEWRERADSSEAVSKVVARLAEVAPGDHAALLRIAGFTVSSYQPPGEVEIEQSCKTCMYYAQHRRFCDLPELRVPVRPEWSCRLWRV